jgi:iron complex transport system permease protein
VFVTLCDVLTRVVFAPYEFPAGILISLLGGPFFLSLLMGGKRGRLYD